MTEQQKRKIREAMIAIVSIVVGLLAGLGIDNITPGEVGMVEPTVTAWPTPTPISEGWTPTYTATILSPPATATPRPTDTPTSTPTPGPTATPATLILGTAVWTTAVQMRYCEPGEAPYPDKTMCTVYKDATGRVQVTFPNSTYRVYAVIEQDGQLWVQFQATKPDGATYWAALRYGGSVWGTYTPNP